jgi:hypothetical protein
MTRRKAEVQTTVTVKVSRLLVTRSVAGRKRLSKRWRGKTRSRYSSNDNHLCFLNHRFSSNLALFACAAIGRVLDMGLARCGNQLKDAKVGKGQLVIGSN